MDHSQQEPESMTQPKPHTPRTLSLSTASLQVLNLEAVRDQAAGIFKRSSSRPESLPDEDAVGKVFERARGEFDKALNTLRTLTNRLLLYAGGATVLAVGGAVGVAFVNVLAGGAVATGGVAGMLVVFKRIYDIGRDQAVLELLPTRYEMALAMASTEAARADVLKRFLEEMEALSGLK